MGVPIVRCGIELKRSCICHSYTPRANTMNRCSGKFVAPENNSHMQQYGLWLRLEIKLKLGLGSGLRVRRVKIRVRIRAMVMVRVRVSS